MKLQHVCLLIPWQAIFGQDGEQFIANGLLRRCVSILTHLERVEGIVARTRKYNVCQKMTMDTPPAPLNKSSKRACSVSKMKGAVYTPSRNFNQDGPDGYPCESSSRGQGEPLRKTPPENSTLDSRPLNHLFRSVLRWIMWERTPPWSVGLCRNAISRPRRDGEAGG